MSQTTNRLSGSSGNSPSPRREGKQEAAGGHPGAGARARQLPCRGAALHVQRPRGWQPEHWGLSCGCLGSNWPGLGQVGMGPGWARLWARPVRPLEQGHEMTPGNRLQPGQGRGHMVGTGLPLPEARPPPQESVPQSSSFEETLLHCPSGPRPWCGDEVALSLRNGSVASSPDLASRQGRAGGL